jgi:hypothetical protein
VWLLLLLLLLQLLLFMLYVHILCTHHLLQQRYMPNQAPLENQTCT